MDMPTQLIIAKLRGYAETMVYSMDKTSRDRAVKVLREVDEIVEFANKPLATLPSSMDRDRPLRKWR